MQIAKQHRNCEFNLIVHHVKGPWKIHSHSLQIRSKVFESFHAVRQERAMCGNSLSRQFRCSQSDMEAYECFHGRIAVQNSGRHATVRTKLSAPSGKATGARESKLVPQLEVSRFFSSSFRIFAAFW
jgi:hypothetical protein